jgi:hypothetical protein
MVNVGGGIAGIGGTVRTVDFKAAIRNPSFWTWATFAACVAWLLGLFAAFGGYKGDVAS